MLKRLSVLTASFVFALPLAAQESKGKIMLVVHGGAGTITRKSMTAEAEQQYRAKLEESMRAGHTILARGGSSLDAVETSIRILEDSPLFNAGKGAVFTHDGRNELDASIMDGKTLRAGAVAGVTIIKNPISAARAVMEKSKHVMMVGRGAELFATKVGLEIVDPSYFWTERRWRGLQQELLKEQEQQKPKAEVIPIHAPDEKADSFIVEKAYGTVGVVALDRSGNLAAGTSTGGMTNKMFGRVGDSPIIGAGTYADNSSCAISATGDGEYFIRLGVARDIAALMAYRSLSVQQAADEVIQKKLESLGGKGGVIGVDAKGNIAISFNSEGMYRGWIGEDGKPTVMIYRD